jgi:Ca2+-binding RTX toxin-like protein
VGGNGDDYIDGGEGVDTLEGGFGNDTLVVDDPLDAMREFGVEDGSIEGLQPLGGRDTVITSVSLSLSDTIVDGGKFIENLQISNDEDGLNLSGNRLNNIMRDGEGDNQLFGKAGNDSLVGGNGSDWISGDAGDDILWGTTGDPTIDNAQIDTLTGGAGRDIFALWDASTGIRLPYYNLFGEADHAVIRDFDKANDKLGVDLNFKRYYSLSNALPAGVSKGQSLYLDNTELVAVIQTSDGSALNLSKDSIFTEVPSFFKI